MAKLVSLSLSSPSSSSLAPSDGQCTGETTVRESWWIRNGPFVRVQFLFTLFRFGDWREWESERSRLLRRAKLSRVYYRELLMPFSWIFTSTWTLRERNSLLNFIFTSSLPRRAILCLSIFAFFAASPSLSLANNARCTMEARGDTFYPRRIFIAFKNLCSATMSNAFDEYRTVRSSVVGVSCSRTYKICSNERKKNVLSTQTN